MLVHGRTRSRAAAGGVHAARVHLPARPALQDVRPQGHAVPSGVQRAVRRAGPGRPAEGGRRPGVHRVRRRGVRPDGLPGGRGRPDLLPRGELHLLGVLPGGVPGLCGLHPRVRRDRPGRASCAPSSTKGSRAMPAGSRPTRSGRAATASPCSPPATSPAAQSCSKAKAGRSASSRAPTWSGRGRLRTGTSSTATRTPSAATSSCCGTRNPAGWAPQNHSCDPNTEFVGLNLVARRDIRGGEELTVDYATFYDRHMTPFDCACGSPLCRGRVEGGKGLFG